MKVTGQKTCQYVVTFVKLAEGKVTTEEALVEPIFLVVRVTGLR